MHLAVVDGDEDHPVLPQQLPGQPQAGIDHAEPLGVEAAVGLLVGRLGAPLAVDLAGTLQIILQGLGEVVVVDEVVAGVVGGSM